MAEQSTVVQGLISKYKAARVGTEGVALPRSGMFEADLPQEWEQQASQYIQNANERYRMETLSPDKQYDSRGIPVDWNYRTAKLGPDNQPLPDGAQGWLPTGEVNWGEGLGGFMKKLYYNFWGARNRSEDIPAVQTRFNDFQQNVLLPTAQQLKSQPKAETIEQAAQTAGLYGKALVGGIGTGIQLVADGWGQVEGDKLNLINAVPRFVGAAIDTIGFAFGEWDRFWEENVFGPQMLAAETVLRESQGVSDAKAGQWRDWMRKIGPFGIIPLNVELAANIVSGTVKLDDYLQEFSASNGDSARIAYSMWREPALREEYNRRMQGGEDPRLLALELENPWAEMFSELVFDPLNYIGFFHRKVAEARRLRGLARGVTLADDAPVVVKANALRVAAEANDANRIRAAADDLALELKRLGDDAARGMSEEAGRKGVFRATGPSKQHTYTERTGFVLHHINSAGEGKPDKVLGILEARIKIASGDADQIKEGMVMLNKLMAETGLDAKFLFSPYANDAFVIMRDLAMKGNKFDLTRIIKLIEKSKGDVKKLNELFNAELDTVIKTRFPTIETHTLQHEEWRALNASDPEKAAKYLIRHPIADQAPNRLHQMLLPIHKRAERIFYRPASNFQGVVFLGANPAYRVRNRVGNFIVLLTDQGPGPAFGALLPEIFGSRRAKPEIRALSGGQWYEAANRAIGPAGSAKYNEWSKLLGRFDQAAGAAADEGKASLMAFAKSYKGTMNRLMKKSLKANLDKWMPDAGDQKRFMRLLQDKRWDFDAALTKWFSDEGIEVSRDLSAISDELYKIFHELELDDEVRKILENPNLDTPEKINRALDDLADEWSDFGLRASGEPVLDAVDDADPDHQQFLEDLVHLHNNSKNDELGDLISRAKHQNRVVDDAVEADLDQLVKTAQVEVNEKFVQEIGKKGGSITTREAHEAAGVALAGPQEVYRGAVRKFTENTRKEIDGIRNYVLDITDTGRRRRIKSTNRATRTRAWKKLEEPLGLGPMPDDLTPAQFRRRIWEGYFSKRTAVWQKLREDKIKEYRKLSDALGNMAGISPRTTLTPAVDSNLLVARMLDRAEMINGRAVVRASGNEVLSLLKREFEKSLLRDELVDPLEKRLRGVRNPDDILRQIEAWRKEGLTVEDVIARGYGDIEIRSAFLAVGGPQRKKLLEFLLARPGLRVGEEAIELTAEGITGLVEGLTDLIKVNPEVHKGLITLRSGRQTLAQVEFLTAEGKIAEVGEKAVSFRINLTDELLKKTPGEIKEILSHEMSHVYEKLAGGEDVVSKIFKGDQEDFAHAILEELGLNPRTKRTKKQMAAVKQLLDDNPSLTDPIKKLAGAEEEQLGKFDINIVVGADDGVPSPARVAHETTPVVRRAVTEAQKHVTENWGRVERYRLPEGTSDEALQAWKTEARRARNEARAISGRVATATRDFALHDYGQRLGLDLLAGYIFPYQFWYSRSYAKWMKRLANNPGVAAGYLRYRETLEKEHAGLPDYWKHQLNVSELLGLDTESPLWFNLEALVNPLHGLTGVDFTDPRRRLDWWSATMEDLNKFGPSTWMPFQFALALKYHLEGKEDASARWAGRLLPFSRPLRDVTALLDPNGLGIEIDPFVKFLAGGIDPYEQARVGRQLGAMQGEGKYSPAEIIDAGYTMSGPIWEEAWARAIRERSPNVIRALMPFFGGSGLKPRTAKDVEIDRMYTQMRSLFLQKPNLSAQEYRDQWNSMRQRFPFMELVLMSKKSGLDRDEAFAWTVVSRIAPGQTKVIAELVGIQQEDITNFYESKGDLSKMTEPDRLRFMAAVMEIGAILDVPDRATRFEWDTARGLYQQMRDLGKQQFGEGIWDKVDIYYAKLDPEDPDVGREFLRANPDIEQALDWQQYLIQNTPLLASYYTSQDRIRQWYKQQMYDVAERLFGDNLWDMFEVYGRLKDMGEDKAAQKFWRDNPQLAGYMKFKEDTLVTIEDQVSSFGTKISEPKPVTYREGQEPDLPDVRTPIPDEREAIMSALVTTYANAYTDFRGKKPTEIEQVIAQEANNLWPETRALAQRYYSLARTNTKAATQLLLDNPALAARILWELERVMTLELTRRGDLYAASQMPEAGPVPPQIDPNSPIGRLLSDPEGIPPHLAEAYGINLP